MKWLFLLVLAIGGVVLGVLTGLIIGYRRVIREYLNHTHCEQHEAEKG